ncbi:MAG TPA: DUF1302 family protein [Candidatus Binatia bacterium]|nr:DUF1302 family protein [Candidatus Binatia bacterium]
MKRLHAGLLAPALAAALLAVAARDSHATQRFGPIQLSGNLQTQNLIRHPDAGHYQYIQNRNTAHVRLDYAWLQGGKFYDKYDIPFIETSSLFLLWRGSYDSIYDTTPGFVEKDDIHGKVYEGRSYFDFATKVRGFPRRRLTLAGLPREERDAYKFENTLREAYVDIKFRGLPLNVRAGRQQVVWGESDNFRLLDRVNTLDLTWHLVQEIPPPPFGWDEIRRPFWMLKFLYDIGDTWKFTQTFLEWYWNPGDWYPAKIAFLPRPWGVRLYDPLRNPIDGAFNRGVCENAPGSHCTRLMNGTELFKQGDYHRNPFENSQFGIRYHALAPGAIEFAVTYLYQRWGGDDGSPYAPIRGLPKTARNQNLAYGDGGLIARGIFPVEFIAPYVHTIGASANYSDENYTQAVFRAETAYDVGIPFFDLFKTTVVDRPVVPGIRRKNMWKGMLAFDRPTWIRAINRKTTVGLTGQFFWHYMVNNPSCQPQATAAALQQGRETGLTSCLVGPLDLPSVVRSNSSPEKAAYRDKIRDWETLFTLAAFTFYRGGSILPIVGIAVDPVNHFGMEPFWSLDLVLRQDLSLNLSQRYFVTPRGRSQPVFDPWGFQSLDSGRSESSVRLTYQF